MRVVLLAFWLFLLSQGFALAAPPSEASHPAQPAPANGRRGIYAQLPSAPQPTGAFNLSSLAGKWAVGNLGNCFSIPYDLTVAGDLLRFRDSRGQIDEERLVKLGSEEFWTTTLQSGSNPVGGLWSYQLQGTDQIQVANRTNGKTFTIFRCQSPGRGSETQASKPPPSPNQPALREQIEQLLTVARKQNNPGMLKEFLASHGGTMAREQIREVYFDLSDHVRSHSFGTLRTLKIYEKPDIQGRVMRDESVGKIYILIRREGDFNYIEYDVGEYGYIYHGFID